MTEWRWVRLFADHFARCGLHEGEVVSVLSESSSRTLTVDTARMAAQMLGGSVVDVVVPTPLNEEPVPIRSTGASQALQHHPAAIAALQASGLVLDCTVEGLLHAPELGEVLDAGTRVLMISNEHPEHFERFHHDETLVARVEAGVAKLRAATEMRVTSAAGTYLKVALAGAACAGSTGITDGPGSIAHWPGGLVLAFPAAGSVNGTLVLAPGDANLTFKRYVESPVRLTIVDDYVTDVAGDGVDTDLFASYLAAFGDREAYATSHLGWGLNRNARWDVLELSDKRDHNGTELRAFAGNFLYSCGANEVAKRFTAGHFDLPMRNCTVTLDGTPVVEAGKLVE